ncbi:MAG TPA: hypothetical protein DIT75_01180 [Rikenellaceae bacterium]|nr:hypothetical protein [Rikenellaceae bacterium]
MGNIDEKRLSALLERIDNIKTELEALEKEVRGLGEVAEQLSPVTEPDTVTEPVEVTSAPEATDAVSEHKTTVTEPAEVTAPKEVSSDPKDDTPIEIDLQDIDMPSVIEDPIVEYAVASTTEVPVNQLDDDLPFEDDLPADEPSEILESDAKPIQEPTLDIGPEIGIKPTPEPEPEAKPKAAILDSQKAETAVMDVMAEKQAWRTDRPGSEVKNVISAISLNDRVLLINVLFKEDPILFQNTINAFNGMSNLEEAITYVHVNFPEWDMNSEPVYRLMMAVRRKLR